MATILLVDDMGAARSALRRIIERAGIEVREAPDPGWDAIEPGSAAFPCGHSNVEISNDYGAGLIADLQSELPDIKVVAVTTPHSSHDNCALGDTIGDSTATFAIAQLPRTLEKVLHRRH